MSDRVSFFFVILIRINVVLVVPWTGGGGAYVNEPMILLEMDSDQAVCPNNCGHSYKGINRKKLLRRHMVYECGTPSKFGCPICMKRFTRKSNMKTHVTVVHNVRMQSGEDRLKRTVTWSINKWPRSNFTGHFFIVLSSTKSINRFIFERKKNRNKKSLFRYRT